MAHVTHFDTLAYANKLKEAGVPSKQAEIQAEALAEIFEDRVATRHDIEALENKIYLKFAEFKVEIIKWVVGISAAQAALIIAILKFFH